MKEKENEIVEKGVTGMKILKICLWSLFGIVAVVILAVLGVIAYLTPQRISDIVEREAAEHLNADVRIVNPDYTLFSSYPWLCVTMDSLIIDSKSLEGLSPELGKMLPSDASNLVRTGEITVDLNVPALFRNKVKLRNVTVSSPDLNIVIATDSLNNFTILKPEKKEMKMPEISLRKISVIGDSKIRLTDLPRDLKANLGITKLLFEPSPSGEDNSYLIDLNVLATGSYGSLSLPKVLPIDMAGVVNVDLNSPERIGLSNFNLKIPELSLFLNLWLNIKEEILGLEKVNVRLELADLFSALQKLPEGMLPKNPMLSDLEGYLPLQLEFSVDDYELKLKDKPEMTLKDIPTFNARIATEGASLTYKGGSAGSLEIDSIYFHTGATYNHHDRHADINIDNLRFRAAGLAAAITASAKGEIEGVMDLEGGLSLTADIPEIIKDLNLGSYKINGEPHVNVSFTANYDMKGNQLSNIAVEGDANAATLSVTNSSLTGNLRNVEMSLQAQMPVLNMTSPTGDLQFGISVGKGEITSGKSMKGNFSDTSLKIDASSKNRGGNSQYSGNLEFSSGTLAVNMAKTMLSLTGLDFTLDGTQLSTPPAVKSYTPSTPTPDEKILAERVNHTPFTLVTSPNGIIQGFLPQIGLKAALKIKSGSYQTPAYLANNSFSDVDISTDLETIDINGLKLRSDNSSLALNGKITGLRSYLVSSAAAPLDINLNVYFDNVDINGLSGAYYGALEKKTGKPYDFNLPPLKGYTAADSTCILIPRNLSANVNLYAERAEYMGFAFSPLSTRITLNDGVAALRNLSIGTPYCNVDVDWIYSTKRIDDIFMTVDADVKNFDFTNFFKTFPKLVEKSPELDNLSGNINATVNSKFLMFPSMFMNIPSLYGKFDIEGDEIEFAREGKFEKITHLMMIHGEEPIKLYPLRISGLMHDCLLTVNPVEIKFGPYELEFAGVNNLQGDMYYHLALLKSPFHLPFAVNIVDNFKHPEIRLGGTRIKYDREKKISSDLNDSLNINIMTQLQRGWLMFVGEAAKYDLRQKNK